jgi:hypothetical protein
MISVDFLPNVFVDRTNLEIGIEYMTDCDNSGSSVVWIYDI